MDKTFIPTTDEIDDMVGLDTVTIVGYPNGLQDSINICRYFEEAFLLRTTSATGTAKGNF
jgi:hypothetical protein